MGKRARTLLEVVRRLSDPQVAHEFFVSIRWPHGAWCPHMGCGSADVARIGTRNVWRCRDCKQQFTAKVGTIFEDSPIGFNKWIPAMWMLNGDRNGTSSCELARKVGVTQKSAWFMLHRIRLAQKNQTFEKLRGPVEADETYVGGKAQSVDYNPETGKLMPTGPQANKTIVAGIVERKGKVRAFVIPDTKKGTLVPIIETNVIAGSSVYTDALGSYNDLSKEYKHFVINHAIEYVNGHIHTNGIENFWSALKRTLKGTYIYTSTQHLERYLDEQIFRHNNKDENDAVRTKISLKQVEGKRLTYKALTITVNAKQMIQKAKLRAATLKRLAAKA
jgi:transposase-like protein